MRFCIVATLIPGFLLGGFGDSLGQEAELPKPPDETRVAPSLPEVLCSRNDFRTNLLFGNLAFTFNSELAPVEGKKAASGTYGLSSVTVPQGGWKVDSIAIYTDPGEPAEWLKVGRGRLNVFAKKGDLPGKADDPRKGREVEVTVRESQEGVYELRAADLELNIQSGEYWIGLTPICTESNGFAGHLIVSGVLDARFDDADCAASKDLSAEDLAWKAVNPTRPGEHLSIHIEGWPIGRGQVLDWPSPKVADTKQLHLRYDTFDPVTQPPVIPKELTASAENLWIVQCRKNVDQPFRNQLIRAGATLLRYVPDDAYIVRLEPGMVDATRRLESVRWIGQYHPAYRLDPSVVPEPFTRNYSYLTMRSQTLEPEAWRYVFVHLFDRDEGDKNRVGKVIEDAGGEVVFKSPRGFYLVANMPQDQLSVVAECEAVCAIERRYGAFELGASGKSGDALPPLGKGLITLSQIRELCGAEAIRKAGGYEGIGVRVAFWDLGIRDDHIDLLARPLTIFGPKYWAEANHGTAVASILCGEGRGDPRAKGLLPLGGLVFATDQAIPLHEDRYSLAERFVRDHRAVVLSSSSSNWGGGGYIKHYDGYSYLLDDLVLEHDLLICTGMSNNPGQAGKCGTWSKNALLVGGVNPRGSLHREDHRYGHHTSGPAPDGRVKPDLVHFGRNVYCANATSAQGYGSFGGTSCATPLVAGHCGLMMELWADGVFGHLPLGRSVFDRKPHAATAKALMINSAYRYSVDGNKHALTRFKQGWGMPDLGRLHKSRDKLFVVNQETALRDHQAIEYRFEVAEGEPELRVTLAYTDPLGTTAAARALVNDLDLIVVAPDGQRFYGNHGLLDGNVSVAAGTPDRLNNVENVFLNNPAPGNWKVIVATHRIAWDQHSDTTAWDQNFGLVVYGVESKRMHAK